MSDLQGLVLIWTAQATVVLGLGLGASVLWRRRAAVSHAMLLLSLVGVLVLPLAGWGMRIAGAGLLNAARQEAGKDRAVEPAPAASNVAAGRETAPVHGSEHAAIPEGPEAKPASTRDNPALLAAPTPWAPALATTAWLAWGLLSLIAVVRLVLSIGRGIRLRRSAEAVNDARLLAALHDAQRDLGVGRQVELRRSAQVACPMICCWATPCVLVPTDGPPEVNWPGVMAHELAHLKRMDHVGALLAEIVGCLLPWHPLVWLARHRLGVTAERACDEWALRAAPDAPAYAATLLSFVAQRRSSVLAPAIRCGGDIRGRVIQVLSGRRGPVTVGRRLALVVSAFALGGVALAALVQPAAPAAQPDPLGETEVDVPTRIEMFLDYWQRTAAEPELGALFVRAQKLGDTKDPRIIPPLIGVIDADNAYNTIYGVGYFGLSKVTGVTYSPFHDGAWWRRWWAANAARFPEEVRRTPIPRVMKSPAGKHSTPLPENLDTPDGKLEWLVQELKAGRVDDLHRISAEIAKDGEARAIPVLIGVIDADNSEATIYGVGYSGLRPLTDVKYSPFHDGAWWRRWWEANKTKFPPEAQATPIPDLPKTANGAAYKPLPADLDTYEGLSRKLLAEYAALCQSETDASTFGQQLAALGDPRAIPLLIGVIDADNSPDAIYGFGYYGLAPMTKARYSPFHDGAWWRRWWEANKANFPPEAQATPIPDLPRTPRGAAYTPLPADLDTFDGLVRKLLEDYRKPQDAEVQMSAFARQFVELGDPRAIPVMIGVIDADNSEPTIYGLGYFGIGEMADVRYSPFHDGAWWRRWWKANQGRFPEAARAVPIPDLPKTDAGRRTVPIPESFETLDGKFAWFMDALRSGWDIPIGDFGEAVAAHKDPRAIPMLIGIVDADNTERTISTIGYGALGDLTGVEHDMDHDAPWWRAWWEKNKANYPAEAQQTPIPDLKALFARWAAGEEDRARTQLNDEFAGYPCQDLLAGGNEKQRYFLIGAGDAQAIPADGWRLLLILPGGGGGADFQPFCRRIQRNALPDGFVAAELVAPVWSDNPNRTVWPTRKLNDDGATFTTEEFISAVVGDVSSRLKIDRTKVLALGWSSSGPALYCDSLTQQSPVTGWFVAMSVFRPEWMPDIVGAKGRRYYILHPPGDKLIPIDKHARVAVERLRSAGAEVELKEYSGGHGWTEDPFGNIRRGVEWLSRDE